MTFRQWLEKYAPNRFNKNYYGGVRGCPMDKSVLDCDTVGACTACWDREMPGTIRVRKARTVRTILFNQEEVIDNCCVVIWRNTETGEKSFGWMRMTKPQEKGE